MHTCTHTYIGSCICNIARKSGKVGEVIGEAAAANVIRTFDDSILAQQVMRMYSA